MSLSEDYKGKLVTAEKAVRIVKSGNWVEYGSFLGMVRACDKALAQR
jgi:acyl-CoA hydrolase